MFRYSPDTYTFNRPFFFHRHSFSQLPTSCLRPLVIREKKVLFPLLLTICVTFCRGTFFSLPSVLPVSFSLKNCSFVTNLRLFRKAGKIFFLSTGIFFLSPSNSFELLIFFLARPSLCWVCEFGKIVILCSRISFTLIGFAHSSTIDWVSVVETRKLTSLDVGASVLRFYRQLFVVPIVEHD